MRTLKGYRSIVFNLLMGAASMAGLTLDPAHAMGWAGAAVTVWTVGGILLRAVTDSPMLTAGHPEVAAVAADLEPLMPAPDIALPPLPESPNDLVGLATYVTTALHTIQSIHDGLMAPMKEAAVKVAAVKAPAPVPNPAPGQTGGATNA
jgi:hypothetical protein